MNSYKAHNKALPTK